MLKLRKKQILEIGIWPNRKEIQKNYETQFSKQPNNI
jgi:hypothetical protein